MQKKKDNQWIVQDIYSNESRVLHIKIRKPNKYLRFNFYYRSLVNFFRKITTFSLNTVFLKFCKEVYGRLIKNHTRWVNYPRSRIVNIVEIPQLRWLFSNMIKGGLTVFISVLVIYGVVHAGTITPPSGTPSAQFYTLSEIYDFIANNTDPGEAGSHNFDFTENLEGTGRTLTEIYNKLAEKIALIDPAKILTGETYFGKAGTMANNGNFSLTATASDQSVDAGYYSGGTLTGDVDLTGDNIKKDTIIFGVTGTLAPDGTAAQTDCLDTKTFYSGGSWAQKTGSIANCSSEGGNACYANSGYWTSLSGDSISGEDGSKTFNIPNGYYSDKTVTCKDTDLVAGNIMSGIDIFGVIGSAAAGYTYGSSDPSQVLTSAGAGAGTYNANNLSTATVKKGTAFGVSETGAYSGYPGSGANRADLTQATCAAAANWYWFEDGNGDGDTTDPEDGICVYAPSYASLVTAASWNGYDSATNYDNTYIADYTCDGVNFPNGNVATYSGIDSSGNPDTTWNEVDCALCKADCMDGVKDLPANGGYKSAPGDGTATGDYNGPLTPKVLAEWKGTRLPTSADFFGFCGYQGNGSAAGTGNYSTTNGGYAADKTFGSYGTQVGRTDEFLDLANKGTYEWLSEQHYYYSARVAGPYACSSFYYGYVYYGGSFRAVFRP